MVCYREKLLIAKEGACVAGAVSGKLQALSAEIYMKISMIIRIAITRTTLKLITDALHYIYRTFHDFKVTADQASEMMHCVVYMRSEAWQDVLAGRKDLQNRTPANGQKNLEELKGNQQVMCKLERFQTRTSCQNIPCLASHF